MNTNNSILSKKSKRISVSFTPGEYDTIHSTALSYNQSDSAYIRNCILNKWNPVITPKQYAKICNTMQYISSEYSNIPGLCNDIDRLNSQIQHYFMEV